MAQNKIRQVHEDFGHHSLQFFIYQIQTNGTEAGEWRVITTFDSDATTELCC